MPTHVHFAPRLDRFSVHGLPCAWVRASCILQEITPQTQSLLQATCFCNGVIVSAGPSRLGDLGAQLEHVPSDCQPQQAHTSSSSSPRRSLDSCSPGRRFAPGSGRASAMPHNSSPCCDPPAATQSVSEREWRTPAAVAERVHEGLLVTMMSRCLVQSTAGLFLPAQLGGNSCDQDLTCCTLILRC
jgi:hypothetical protein